MTSAFRNRVIELIQDVNGNHVIQKCLSRLTWVDSEVNILHTALSSPHSVH